jgi:hypothetical protein
MAVRMPLHIIQNITPNDPVENDFALRQYPSDFYADILSYSSYVHAQDPAVQIEIGTSNGTLLPNQAFTDTYYIAGASNTRVDRYSTEAETANISMVTDTYSRIREVRWTGGLPSGDTNNLQYPLYLDTTLTPPQLKTMTINDFIDTFALPSLDQFINGDPQQKGGLYFMTTSATPANATLASATPAAVNSVSNLAAYSAGGIGETLKQTTDTNYYIAKTDYAFDDDYFEPIELNLPLYVDSGSEDIKQHTPASWTTLLSPFLKYYLAGGSAAHRISYNVDGAEGDVAGTAYFDSRRTPTGTGYNTRFVNANDYRAQEFPTGTESTVTGSQKEFKMLIGPSAGASYDATLDNANFSGSASSNGLGGSCNVQLTWEASGTVSISGSGNPMNGADSFSWLLAGGTASDYEVSFAYNTVTTGGGSTTGSYRTTTSNTVIPTSATWYTADAEYRWKINDSGTSPSASTMNGILSIREASTGDIIDTLAVAMSANHDP